MHTKFLKALDKALKLSGGSIKGKGDVKNVSSIVGVESIIDGLLQ